jgi:YhcH/YjgK/YiaL family protein
MILCPLAEAGTYAALGPRFAAGFAWLRAFDPALPDGRHPVDGDDVFALVATYETGPSTEKRFEAHRRHADIQFVAAGAERMLYLPVAGMTVETPHDDEADVAFFAEPPYASSLLVEAGGCAVFFPADAHKPGCMAGGRHAVRKVVVKVRL